MGSVQFLMLSSSLELFIASTKCLWQIDLRGNSFVVVFFVLFFAVLCICAICVSVAHPPHFWHPGSGVVCTFKDKTYNPGDSWHPYLEPFGLMFCMRCVCTEVPFNICSLLSLQNKNLKEYCTKLLDLSIELWLYYIALFFLDRPCEV